ncbi:MAG: cell division protein ZapA [Lachnospiraceae bacterium]|nr:cell division protein ZapA [Lachnospiraceae bacterium]
MKNETEVLIGGKIFVLSGHESEEYMQKVAMYINGKIAEYADIDAYRSLSTDYKNVLLQLNIADDYFKALSRVEELEEELEAKERELYGLKNDLISHQMLLEKREKTIQSQQNEINECNRQIARMEAVSKITG